MHDPGFLLHSLNNQNIIVSYISSSLSIIGQNPLLLPDPPAFQVMKNKEKKVTLHLLMLTAFKNEKMKALSSVFLRVFGTDPEQSVRS
ncbi:hypothetical protein EO95_18455 [Methanosarcina sp. 1.H.T.1A.1]|nr:hypothetical protein EO95_18455 [Methanosarcina sp. 1.H.T.1A.1]